MRERDVHAVDARRLVVGRIDVREAVAVALECIAAVDDVARAGVNYAGGGDAERRATIGDARGRVSHRRAHARRIRCRRATD